jgi:hypothetical protein
LSRPSTVTPPKKEGTDGEGEKTAAKKKKLTPEEREEKVTELNGDIKELQGDQRNKKSEFRQIESAYKAAGAELSAKEAALRQVKAQIGYQNLKNLETLPAADRQSYEAANKAVAEAKLKKEALKAEYDRVKLEERDLNTEIASKRRERDKIDSEEQCDGNCEDLKKGSSQSSGTGKSGWEAAADFVKAATPLALGAYGIYSGVRAQKDSYRHYVDSNNAMGVPSASPSGYGGVIGGKPFQYSMLTLLFRAAKPKRIQPTI